MASMITCNVAAGAGPLQADLRRPPGVRLRNPAIPNGQEQP